jgi:hypothetical protein
MTARPWMAMAAALTTLAGCVLVPQPAALDPVPRGPLGPIRAAPGGGLPIECRGVPIERCLEVGTGVPVEAGAIRIIVSCEILLCTETDAAFRLDSVGPDGSTTNIGRGAWGSAQPP